jgi:transcriptional regulator with XRE-family HTH domain
VVNVALLKQEIDDLGITYISLAEKCGVSRQTISNWLEKPDLISATHAKKLADALRITDSKKLLAIFFAPNVEKTSTK